MKVNYTTYIKKRGLPMKKLANRLALPALLAVLLFMATELLSASQNESEVGIFEKLDEYIPDNIQLTNSNGQAVNLKEIINKPTVLNFVYFRCPGICSPLMNGLTEVINSCDLELGKDYQVVTISFDSREGYELAGSKRSNYIKKMLNKADSTGWYFLTGDSLNIAWVTQSTGFGFKLAGTEFMHEGALIMISPDGKITRYLKGISFLPFEFKLALIEASKGKSSPTVTKVIQFCYTFDVKSQRYVLDITRITAIFIIIVSLTLLTYLLIRSRKRKTT
jgi:protein SCO1/2